MITIKTQDEIAMLREGGKKLAEILKKTATLAKPGVSTADLEEAACELIKKNGGRPSFLGYPSGRNGERFPTALCTSINDEIVHSPSIPGKILKSGDILSIDVGMEYPFRDPGGSGRSAGGYFTDTALTVPIGKISPEARKLIAATKHALDSAIKAVKPGATLNDIGRAVERSVERHGYGIVRDLVGHGVGYGVHEPPQIPNYEIRDKGHDDLELLPGMVLAIEPMITLGTWKIRFAKDPFTIRTADGSLAAHFEHTVCVTDKGRDIIT
jgi:methionyl aminopeptidase